MFFLPKILKGPFNRYYVIAASSDMPSGLWNTQRIDLTASAYGFVQQLYVSDHYWTQLLDAYAHRDWRYTNQTIIDRVCALLQSRRVNAYEVPNPDAPHSSISCSFTDNKTATRYIFLPGNAHLVIQTEARQTFASLQAAESFLASAQLDDEQVNLLVSQLKEDPFSDNSVPPRKRLAQAMVAGTLSVGIARTSAGAKSQSSAPEEVVVSTRPPTLGPHDEPGYVAPIPAAAATPVKPVNPPAQSLEECEQRLIAAREKLDRDGYQPKYTDAEQLEKVKNGTVSEERFLVSFQTKSTDPNAKLAFQRESELVPVWATSFDQLEYADSDPELIAEVLGTIYDPSNEYVLHIIDRGEGMNEFGQNTIVPTWENMQAPTQQYLGGKHDPEVLAKVMTPEYQKQYARHIDVYKKASLKEFNAKDQQVYLESLSIDEKAKFNARHNVRTEIGANSEFTGNGLTQSRHGSSEYGVVETLTLENDPPLISEMSNVKTIVLKSRGNT